MHLTRLDSPLESICTRLRLRHFTSTSITCTRPTVSFPLLLDAPLHLHSTQPLHVTRLSTPSPPNSISLRLRLSSNLTPLYFISLRSHYTTRHYARLHYIPLHPFFFTSTPLSSTLTRRSSHFYRLRLCLHSSPRHSTPSPLDSICTQLPLDSTSAQLSASLPLLLDVSLTSIHSTIHVTSLVSLLHSLLHSMYALLHSIFTPLRSIPLHVIPLRSHYTTLHYTTFD